MKLTCNFNKIWLLNSTPAGEMNIARRLEESSLNEGVIRNPNLSTAVKYLPDKNELFLALDAIAERARNGEFPFLHLDMHGNSEGLLLANKEFVTWAELRPSLISINLACRLNLFIAVSACQGGYASFTSSYLDRAPFWAMCGPLIPASAGQLYEDYELFYRSLLSTLDCQRAYEALNANRERDKIHLFKSAGSIFAMGWAHYLENELQPKAIQQRVEKLVKNCIEDMGAPKNQIARFRKMARQELRNPREHFENSKARFFMFDIYPENSARFDLKIEELYAP